MAKAFATLKCREDEASDRHNHHHTLSHKHNHNHNHNRNYNLNYNRASKETSRNNISVVIFILKRVFQGSLGQHCQDSKSYCPCDK